MDRIDLSHFKKFEAAIREKNLKNLYEDFYLTYKELPVNELTQSQMFNSFVMGAICAKDPESLFNKGMKNE